MTQRILIELLLFSIPFAVFLVYRAASRDLKIKDRWPLTRLVIVGAVIAILGLIIPPLFEQRDTNLCGTPTQYTAEGKVVRSERVACTEAALPGSGDQPAPPAQAPVAPRDTGN